MNEVKDLPDDLISEEEARKILKVGKTTLWRWRKRVPPQFKTYVRFGDSWCVSKAEVMKYANVKKKKG